MIIAGNVSWHLLCFLLVMGCPLSGLVAQAIADDWVQLPEKSFQVDIAGRQSSIIVHPKIKSVTEHDRVQIASDADFDLHAVQNALKDALDTTWKAERCGDHLRTENSVVSPKGEGLRVEADVHYVRWICRAGIRTHAATADGRVCVDLTMKDRKSVV